MKTSLLALLAIACSFSLMGCAHQQPLMSHAHVGHGLTHWVDTPDNQGLFQVARTELDVALHEASAALASDQSPMKKAGHIRNAAHALNPGAPGSGPGLGYGAIRALESAIEHLEYAATSDDASANVVSSVAPIAEIGAAIVERLRLADEAAGNAGGDVASLHTAAFELRTTLRAAALGYDADGNGRIDATPAEAGLAQLHSQLDAMLARESDPKYAPLPKKYLLGVVRLPSGKWAFDTLRKALGRPSYGHTASSY
jgi:hypothetical protein